LGGTGYDFGLTEVILCLGVLFGSFVIPSLCEKIGRISCLFICIVWLSVFFFSISQVRSIVGVVVLYGLLGLGLPLWSVIASYSQEMTNKSMQGRVQSVANSLSSCLLMAVYFFMACLSEYFTIAHVYWFCSLLGVGALVLLQMYRQTINSDQVLGN